MSVEAVKQFVEKMNSDPDLQEKIKALGAGGEDVLEKGLAIASEAGFEITADDYKAYVAEQAGGELTDQELENVAGGGCGFYVDFCKGKD